MKKMLLFQACIYLCYTNLHAQVTRINNNNSLQPIVLLNNNLALAVSATDQTLWKTDGTLAGTTQLSSTIEFDGYGGILNGKYIFEGSTATTGWELYITDGTPGGTMLLADIIPGNIGSEPSDNFVVLNGFMYFTATTAATGRELWRTNGTAAGTTMVKDIFPLATGSNEKDRYELSLAGNYLLFAASGSAASGIELWRSDGTAASTILVKEINMGSVPSNPRYFYNYKNRVLFAATNAATGDEIWATNGTEAGTVLLKDINPGQDSSTYASIEVVPGLFMPFNVFFSFHEFNGNLYFTAFDGTGGGGIWRTDGTTPNTALVKEMASSVGFFNIGFGLFLNAFNLPGKFLFPYAEIQTKGELWECDGTTAGTKLFKSFPVNSDDDIPLIYVNLGYNAATQTLIYPLYNGKFFFSAEAPNGNELWSTDGVVANTLVVKDINPSGDGIDLDNSTYLYTTAGLHFAGNDGVHGNELWKTNGTGAGTSMVQDIYLNAGEAEPTLYFIVNGKILFTATDGDDVNNTDLFVVDGNFIPLPVQLFNFSVLPAGNDALLNWRTTEEKNTKDFTVQSSDDAAKWKDVAKIKAAGNSSTKRDYSYTDPGVMNSGQKMIYYRLVSSDINGHTSVSKIISLKLNEVRWNVELVSNPIIDKPQLIFAGAEGVTRISIKDITGKRIYDHSIPGAQGEFTVPVYLKRGVYILLIADKTHEKSFKIIKE